MRACSKTLRTGRFQFRPETADRPASAPARQSARPASFCRCRVANSAPPGGRPARSPRERSAAEMVEDAYFRSRPSRPLPHEVGRPPRPRRRGKPRTALPGPAAADGRIVLSARNRRQRPFRDRSTPKATQCVSVTRSVRPSMSTWTTHRPGSGNEDNGCPIRGESQGSSSIHLRATSNHTLSSAELMWIIGSAPSMDHGSSSHWSVRKPVAADIAHGTHHSALPVTSKSIETSSRYTEHSPQRSSAPLASGAVPYCGRRERPQWQWGFAWGLSAPKLPKGWPQGAAPYLCWLLSHAHAVDTKSPGSHPQASTARGPVRRGADGHPRALAPPASRSSADNASLARPIRYFSIERAVARTSDNGSGCAKS